MEKQFSTQDFYLAALLLARGNKLVDFFRKSGYTTFIFSETEEIRESIKNFYEENAMIDANKYGRSVKNLKSLIHSETISTSKSVNNNEFNNNYKGNK
jgi:Domain of unknown function (DUF5659)